MWENDGNSLEIFPRHVLRGSQELQFEMLREVVTGEVLLEEGWAGIPSS